MSVIELLKTIDSLPRVMHLEFDGAYYQKSFQHKFLPPSDPKSITEELLGKLCVPVSIIDDEFQSFYEFANGMSLFHSDSDNDDSGKYFIPPVDFFSLERLAQETAYMQSKVFEEEAYSGDDLPAYSGGVVIGEAFGTDNPFVLVRWGKFAGNVFYADHDPDCCDWHAVPFSKTLTELLRQIALPPYQGLCHLCGADKIWFS